MLKIVLFFNPFRIREGVKKDVKGGQPPVRKLKSEKVCVFCFNV